MGKWTTKYDDTKQRCRSCGKRLQHGTVIYKELMAVYCRDCGRKRDRKRTDEEMRRAAEAVRKDFAMLPAHAGEGPRDTAFRELEFADGGSYKGDVMAGRMHGRGTYVFRNGDTYAGNFVDGRFEGRGAFTYRDGEQHAGQFSGNQLNDKGYVIYPDGSRIEGDFEDDLFLKGRGWKKFGADKYCGDFGEGIVMDGYGVYVYGNGDVYIGEFKKDEPDGYGRYVFPDGKCRDGVFADGKLTSEAMIPDEVLTFALEAAGKTEREQSRIEYENGTLYTGDSVFGIPDGEGSVVAENGTAYTGEWRLGRLVHAAGRIISKRGSVYQGLIGPGARPEGQGTLTAADGSYIEGRFSGGHPADGPCKYVDKDGHISRKLFLAGKEIGERGWWEKLDSEDEDENGTNLWVVGRGMKEIPKTFPAGYPSLGTVMLAKQVKRIRPLAFGGIYIRRLIVPDTVEEIGEKAFADWGPSQTVAVEGDPARFGENWKELCGARIISLQELVDENSAEPVRLTRQKLRFGRSAWYDGDTLDGVMHGHGIYRFENGDRYEGAFRNGSCCGWGTCAFSGVGTYRGEFREDKCNGAGTMYYDGGDIYIGEWQDGRRQGWGRYIYSDGESVEGRWSEGTLMSECPVPEALIALCPGKDDR